MLFSRVTSASPLIGEGYETNAILAVVVGGSSLLGVQLLGIIAVAAWALVTSGVMFFIIKKFHGLRVPRVVEIEGLDVHEHGCEAYADFVSRIQ